MIVLSTRPESKTMLNVAVHLLNFTPPKIQEAVDLAWMVRKELSYSTQSNNTKLLNIVEYLLQSSPPRIQEAVKLVMLVRAEKISWDSRLRVAKKLFLHGQLKEAQAILFDIDLTDSLSKADDVTFLTTYTEIILEVLLHASFETAKKLATKIAIAKLLSTGIPSFLKVRLMFFDYLLLDGPHYTKQLEDIIKDHNCPVVCSALTPYSSFLQRKAEVILKKPEERRAIKWILDAVLMEYNNIPQKSNILNTVHWLVLNRDVTKALDIMKEHYSANPGYADGYTYLSLFMLTIGDLHKAKKCLSREIFYFCEEPLILFARAVAVGVSGEKKGATKFLQEIYRIDSNFFINSDLPTIWGMFSLLLKAFGQDRLSIQALKLAEKRDPFHKYRSHLWYRVPLGSQIHPIPAFVLPGEFYS